MKNKSKPNNQLQTVRFAIVGCGQIGTRHADKITQLSDMKVVAVCDIIPERAIAIGEKLHCPSYTSLENLLTNPDIDFVNICTPSGLHAGHTITALNAGKHVLCEKPMALSTSDARAMIVAAKKNKRLLYVVKQNRYNPPVKLVKSLLTSGKLGKPLFCTVNVFWNRNPAYYESADWRGTLDLDGGALFTQASHFVDLMLMFMGKIKKVNSVMGTLNHNIEVEDTGAINVEFQSGALGSFNYTTCSAKKNFEGSISLFFTNGTIKIGGEYLNTIDYFQVEGIDSYKLEESGSKPNDYGTYKGSMSNHHEVFNDILQRLNTGVDRENLVLGEEALETIEFIEEAILSAGRPLPKPSSTQASDK